MRRKRFIIAFICGMALALVLGLVACRQTTIDINDVYKEGNIYCATIDFAGGTSGDGTRARTEMHQYVKEDSRLVKPGDSVSVFSGEVPKRNGYTLVGYWRGVKDEDGNITYFEPWDFENDKVTEDVTIFARWRESYKLIIHYGDRYARTQTQIVNQDAEGVPDKLGSISLTGYTIIDSYSSEAAAKNGDTSKKVEFPYTPTEEYSEDSTTWEIWANTLTGTYELISTPDEFKANFYAGTNVYLMNDIDFAGAKLTFPENYTGTFIGNGYTLSNFRVERESSNTNGDVYFGLFKQLTSAAHIENVTFTGVTLNVSLLNTRPNFIYTAGAFVGRAQAGAVIKNVTLQGTFTFTIVESKFEDAKATDPIGEMQEGVVIEGCNWDGVNIINKLPE